jgi:hypothetical protein
VPLGSAAFRVNLLGGLLGSGALALAYLASLDVVERGFGVRHALVPLVPALACVLVGTSPAWLHQAVYAEVYALQAFLLALVVVLAVRSLLGKGVEARWMLGAFLVLGLGLANHHLTAFLVLPSMIAAFTLGALGQMPARPGRLLALAGMLAAAALVVYALVPVRGVASPSLILGRVETLSDFFWLVSAKVYQKSLGTGMSGGDVSGVLFVVTEQIGPWLAVLCLGGLYFSIRVARTRAAGVLLLVVAAVVLAGRMLLSFDRANPDVTGYLLVVLIVAVVALSALAAALWNMSSGNAWLRTGSILALAALTGWQIALAWPGYATRLREGDGVERAQHEIREFGVARLPPGSVAVSTLYATSFLAWYDLVVEGRRPDLRHVPLPFVGYRGEAAVLVETWPELAPLVRGFLVSGALPASEMASLSQDEPVYVEPDPLLDRAHIQYLVPHGIFMAFKPEPVARSDVYDAADESAGRIDALLALGPGILGERQTSRYVLWWLYNRALVLARRGYAQGAIRCADQALSLVAGVPELEKLKAHLEREPGAIDDPSPYLPPP